MSQNKQGIFKRKNASWLRMSTRELQSLVPEKEHQRCIIEYCKKIGIVAWRNNVGVAKYGDNARTVKFGFPGTSDIMGYIPTSILNKMDGNTHYFAVPFFWEVKRLGGKATELQRNFINNAVDGGSLAGIGTFQDFLTFLSDLGLNRC